MELARSPTLASRSGREVPSQAAASDPEIASDWAALERDRRRTMEDVADTLWALASPDLYHLFRTGVAGTR